MFGFSLLSIDREDNKLPVLHLLKRRLGFNRNRVYVGFQGYSGDVGVVETRGPLGQNNGPCGLVEPRETTTPYWSKRHAVQYSYEYCTVKDSSVWVRVPSSTP